MLGRVQPSPYQQVLQRFAKTVFRWGVGRQFFAQTFGLAYVRKSLVPIMLAELLSSPKRAGRLVRLLRGNGKDGRHRGFALAKLRDFRAQLITAQSPPVIDFAAKRASVCRNCPDATVRHGRLVPVCIADMVSPLNPAIQAQLACPEV